MLSPPQLGSSGAGEMLIQNIEPPLAENIIDPVINHQDISFNDRNVDFEMEFKSSHLDYNLFLTDLRHWAVKNHIGQKSLSCLLVVLKKHKLDVPRDSRTLIDTPGSVNLLSMSPGSFSYFGISNGIIRSLEKNYNTPPSIVKFNVNCDGLPLSRQFTYAILANFGFFVRVFLYRGIFDWMLCRKKKTNQC